ncbi:hypothetical protein IAT38_007065 [Cryptococcus sp. DSM 104549]
MASDEPRGKKRKKSRKSSKLRVQDWGLTPNKIHRTLKLIESTPRFRHVLFPTTDNARLASKYAVLAEVFLEVYKDDEVVQWYYVKQGLVKPEGRDGKWVRTDKWGSGTLNPLGSKLNELLRDLKSGRFEEERNIKRTWRSMQDVQSDNTKSTREFIKEFHPYYFTLYRLVYPNGWPQPKAPDEDEEMKGESDEGEESDDDAGHVADPPKRSTGPTFTGIICLLYIVLPFILILIILLILVLLILFILLVLVIIIYLAIYLVISNTLARIARPHETPQTPTSLFPAPIPAPNPPSTPCTPTRSSRSNPSPASRQTATPTHPPSRSLRLVLFLRI